MKVCVTKMTKMTEACALSVCENVQCQHHPCQPLTFFPISQYKDSQGIQKVCFLANRYKMIQVHCTAMCENSGNLHGRDSLVDWEAPVQWRGAKG